MNESQDSPDTGPNWGASAGNAWVAIQDLTDSIFEPVERLLTEEVASGEGNRVLDVGCGTGATTVAIAHRLGPEAVVSGIDVSAPMIEASIERAASAGVEIDFTLADAETHDFGELRFDQVVSRCGVMFFSDPVAAFSNLARVGTGGRLRAITWRSYAENPFMTVAEEAAAPLLEGFEPRRSNDAPGQFGLAEEEYVNEVLGGAGWQDINLRPVDIECSFPESELVRYFSGLGPLARHLDDLPDDQIPENLVETVSEAFSPCVRERTVSFTCAFWMIEANAP